MIKVVVSSPQERIEKYNISPPQNFKLHYIKQPYTDQELIEASKDAMFLLLSLSPASRNVIESLNSVKLIQSEGVGYNGIDLEAAKEKGIYVCNAKGVNKVSVAEHTIGLILASLRRTVQADKAIKEYKFEESYIEYQQIGMRTLKSCHVGILGLGNIGIEVAKRLKPFECKISYYSNHRKSKKLEDELKVEYLSLEKIFKNCDIISLHLPLTSETESLINKYSIKNMKDDVILINTARGEIINQWDLAQALRNGDIGGAAVDTISPQPPDKNHPLLNLPEDADKKLILTTHIAGITTEDLKQMQIIAWNNMEKILNGERPDNIVNGI